MPDDHVRVDIIPEATGPDAPAEETAPPPDAQAGSERADDPAEAGPAPERPAWLPEKFNTAEDLAAAYMALERRAGQAFQAAGDAADSAESARGLLDMGELRPYFDEYGATGRLAEESYVELEQKYGLPRDVVENYITGQVAKSEVAAQRVYDAVGGRQAYDQMIQSVVAAAKEGRIPSSDLDAYNRLLETGDVDTITMAAKGLMASVAPAKPQASSRPAIQPRRPNSSGAAPFANSKQIVAAMRDPRYKSDPAYRDEIDARLRASEAFGQPRG